MPDRPHRIQRKRAKGWRMPPGAVYVGRPSKWGNPYVIGIDVSNAVGAAKMFRLWLSGALDRERGMCADLEFREAILRDLDQLRGRDLVCWCPLDEPCHAEVLLDLSNR